MRRYVQVPIAIMELIVQQLETVVAQDETDGEPRDELTYKAFVEAKHLLTKFQTIRRNRKPK